MPLLKQLKDVEECNDKDKVLDRITVHYSELYIFFKDKTFIKFELDHDYDVTSLISDVELDDWTQWEIGMISREEYDEREAVKLENARVESLEHKKRQFEKLKIELGYETT